MQINFDLKFYKILSVLLGAVLLFVIALRFQEYRKENNPENWNRSGMVYGTPELSKENSYTSVTVTNAQDIHRLSSCVDVTATTTFFIFEENKLGNYKRFVDCGFVQNSYYPDKKSEYFGIVDTKNGIKYYVDNREKWVLGAHSISAINGSLIFLHQCFEGCGPSYVIDLNESYALDLDNKNKMVQPISLDLLYRYTGHIGKILVVNDKNIMVSENKIYQFDLSNLGIKILKELPSGKVFGEYHDMNGDFVSELKVEGNILKYNIFKENETREGESIDSGTLEIK